MANNLDRFKKRGAEPTAPAEWASLTRVGKRLLYGSLIPGNLQFISTPSANLGYTKEYTSASAGPSVCRAFQAKSIDDGWATLANVTGGGFLLWALVYISSGSNVQFRITIDGVSKTSAFYTGSVALGAIGDRTNERAIINRIATDTPSADMTDNQKLYCKHEAAIRGLRFNTSMKIEFRAAESVSGVLSAAADYFLDSEV